MFKERWLLGLAIGAAAAAAIVYFQPHDSSVYRTEVSVLFADRKDRVLNIQEVVDTSLQNGGALTTHIEQLRSKSFFEYLLVSFTPEETKRILAPYVDSAKPEEAPPSLASIIRPNTSFSVRKGTSIVVIGVTNRDPESAALIANRYAQKYINYNQDRTSTGTNQAIIFLRNQGEDMRRQVESAESALHDYRAKKQSGCAG